MTNPTTEMVLERERTAEPRVHADTEERWPLAYSALLVVALSACLWAIILAGVGWMVA